MWINTFIENAKKTGSTDPQAVKSDLLKYITFKYPQGMVMDNTKRNFEKVIHNKISQYFDSLWQGQQSMQQQSDVFQPLIIDSTTLSENQKNWINDFIIRTQATGTTKEHAHIRLLGHTDIIYPQGMLSEARRKDYARTIKNDITRYFNSVWK